MAPQQPQYLHDKQKQGFLRRPNFFGVTCSRYRPRRKIHILSIRSMIKPWPTVKLLYSENRFSAVEPT